MLSFVSTTSLGCRPSGPGALLGLTLSMESSTLVAVISKCLSGYTCSTIFWVPETCLECLSWCPSLQVLEIKQLEDIEVFILYSGSPRINAKITLNRKAWYNTLLSGAGYEQGSSIRKALSCPGLCCLHWWKSRICRTSQEERFLFG